jgi:hypothetical protein
MRLRVSGEGMTTEDIRAISIALAKVGKAQGLTVVSDGERWNFQTPELTGSEFVSFSATASERSEEYARARYEVVRSEA